MRLISLDLENFRQHKRTSIEFREGITGIIGKNGSGKTTLLEAIAWALYGAVAVRGNNEGLRCHASDAGDGVEVRLSFSLDGQCYTVTRRLSPQGQPRGAELAIDGLPARSGFSEVADSVTRILGMDYRAFFNSFFTKQKELEFMAGMSGQERAKAIGRMLDYDRLTRARDRANQDRIALDNEIKGIELALPDPAEIDRRKAEAESRLQAAKSQETDAQKKLDAAQAELEKLTPLKDASEQKAKRYEELSRRIEMDSTEIGRLQEEIERLIADLEDLKAKEKEAKELQSAVEEFRKAQEEHNRLAELQKYESERQKIMGQIERLNLEIAEDSEKMAGLSQAEEELEESRAALASVETELQRARREAETEHEAWTVRKERLTAQIDNLKSSLQETMSCKLTIEQSGPSGTCPTCGRPLGGEYAKVLEGFDGHARMLKDEIARLQMERQEAEREPEGLRTARAVCQTLEKTLAENQKRMELARIRVEEKARLASTLAVKERQLKDLRDRLSSLPVGFDQKRFEELRRLGMELRPKRDRALELTAKVERIPVLRSERERKESIVQTKTREVMAGQDALKELAFSSEEHEQLMRRFADVSYEVSQLQLNLERIRGEVKAALATLDHVRSEKEAYLAKLAELKEKQNQRLYLSTMTEALGALRSELNSRIRPELEETASEILAAITDGRYQMMEIDENYAAWIIDDGERKNVISGGEEDMLNLALRLAISEMIANRSGHQMSLLILDEVFGSLDDARRDSVMSLLANLRNRFEQIILITHIEDIHDAVDNCLWVEYDEERGISRVTERRPEEIASFPYAAG